MNFNFPVINQNYSPAFEALVQKATLPAIPEESQKRNSLIRTVWNKFHRFIDWLLGRKNESVIAEELKLRYAMHLFQTFDASILTVDEHREKEFPLWHVLEARINFLKKFQNELQFSHELLPKLEETARIAKTLHRARQSTASKRKQIIEELYKNLIQSLNANQPVCLPGGILHYRDLSKALESSGIKGLHNLPTHMTHFLCDLGKLSDGTYALRIYNVLEDKEDIAEYKIPENEIDHLLKTLLEVQTTPHEHYREDWVSLIQYSWKFIKHLVAPVRYPLPQDFQLGLSTLKFNDLIEKIAPHALDPNRQTRSDPRVQTAAAKALSFYFNSTDPLHAESLKIGEKITLFLEVYQLCQNRLSDKSIKKWLSVTALSLLKELKHHRHLFQEDETPVFKQKINEIIHTLKESFEEVDMELPGVTAPQTPSKSHFPEPLSFKEELIPLKFYRSAVRSDIKTIEPLRKINFNDAYPVVFEGLESWIETCHPLSINSELETLGYLMKDIQNYLLEADKVNFWDHIPAEGPELDHISSFLYRITAYQIQVHFGMKKPGPLPHQILHYFKNLERCQRLVHRNEDQNCFGRFALQTDFFKEILNDAWLDLDCYGPEIYATLAQIEGKGKILVNLTDPSPIQLQSENDRTFYTAYHEKRCPDDSLTTVPADFGVLLTRSLANLRRLKVLLTAAMARHQVLGNPELSKVIRHNLSLSLDYYRNKIDDFDGEILKKHFEEIDEKLHNRRLPGKMSVSKYKVFDRPTILLEPYGVSFFQPEHTYNDDYGSPFTFKKTASQYKTTAQEVLPAIAYEVIEGAIVCESEGYSDENGLQIPEEAIPQQKHRYIPPGNQSTEGSVIHESRSQLGIEADIWADIRLMQTSPTGTRIPNTLTLFIKYPYLLTHERYGNSFQRVFRLNFFRANALANFVKLYPHQIPIIGQRLTTLVQTYVAKNDLSGLFFMQTLIRDVSVILEGKSEPLSNLVKNFDKQLDHWEKTCDESPLLFPYKRAIYHTFLLLHTKNTNEINDEILIRLLKCYFYVRQIQEPAQTRNRCYEDQIYFFIHQIIPKVEALSQRSPELLNALLNNLTGIHAEKWEKTNQKLCFKSGNREIDLIDGQIYIDDVAKSFLPDAITHDPICRELFGDNEIFTVNAIKEKIYHERSRGQKYQFTYRQHEFQIYLLPGYRKFIYKNIEGDWYQLSNLDNSETAQPNTKSLPQEIYENFFWRSLKRKKFVVENRAGERLFSGLLNSDHKTIESVKNQENLQVLNPWSSKEFSKFLSITPSNMLYALGENGKTLEVIYEAFELSYKWDDRTKMWVTPEYPGYHLSTDPVEPSIFPDTPRATAGSFFSPSFTHYHLLKHTNEPPIVLIPDFEYSKKTRSLEEYRTTADTFIVENQSHVNLYSYEIDLQIGLKSKNPAGYLYLAYVLFVQGKYDLSLNYIEKAKGIDPSYSPECQRILNLFEKWPVRTTRATIIRLHLGLLALVNTSPNLRGQSNYTSLSAQLNNLIPLIDKYNQLLAQQKVPHNLLITNKQKRGLLNHLNSTTLTPSSMAELANSALSNLLTSDIGDKLNSAVSKIQAPLKQLSDNSVHLRTHLDNEIKFLRESLKPCRASIPPSQRSCFEIFPERLLLRFQQRTLNKEISSIDQFIDRTADIQDDYTRELTQEIFDDILVEITSTKSLSLPDDYDFDALSRDTQFLQKELETKILSVIVTIHGCLLKPPQTEETITKAIHFLKNNQENEDHYINKIIYACANDDWGDLISSKIINADLVEDLKAFIQSYLINRTKLQQCQKLISAISSYRINRDPLRKERIEFILLQKRHYNPETDPLRFYLLLLENEQKIIATESQVEHFKSLSIYKDIFKHEALAGGKTTILRNLIAAHNANGHHLSTVVTADTLIDRHHPLLTQTTEEAYGKRCLRIKFSRNDPSDGISLRIILRNLLSATLEGHRIDITRRDGLSLHHAFLLKLEESHDADERYDDLLDEIEILSQILIHLKQYAAANTDEMDAVTSPLIEHNYALGDPRRLGDFNVDFYLGWMHTILSSHKHKRLKQIFLRNEQYKLSWKEFEKSYADLSFDKKRVFQHTFSQRNNVHYTRSSDGYSVKPTLITDFGIIPNELSEFGTEEETILYTCFNYMHEGVTSQQIELIVHQEQKKASDELLLAIREMRSLTYEKTEAAINFKKNFGKELINVSPNDYKEIAFEFSSNPDRLKQFLKMHVFPLIRLCGRKLTGTSYDFVNLFKHFSGSSGTSNSYRALPQKIYHFLENNPTYRRQPGVDGAILAAVMQEYKGAEDLICIDSAEISEVLSIVAENLKRYPGSTLIDASPLFPGMTSMVLATELSKYLEGVTIRYFDSENRICFINHPDRESIDLSEVITILAKGQDRGTHLEMSDRSIGYVTINKTTTYSDFMQAAMRMRKLGKGQKICFITDNETKNLINNDPSFTPLLVMLLSNETEQLKKIHAKAQLPKILAAGKSVLIQFLTHTHHPEERDKLWQNFKQYFITDYGSKIAPAYELATHLSALIDSLNTYGSPILQSIKTEGLLELQGFIHGNNLLDPRYLPENDTGVIYGYMQEAQNAIEIQAAQEQELEIQSNRAPKAPYQSLPYHQFQINTVKQLINQFQETFFQLSDSVDVYDSTIYLSPNLYNPDENSLPWGEEMPSSELPKGQMKFTRIALIISENNVISFLGTNKDFDLFFYPLDKKREENDLYYIYDLENDDLEGELKEWPTDAFIDRQIKRSIVQAKHLSGLCHLTKDQKPILEVWLSEIDNLKGLEYNLMRFLQAVRPSDYPHYRSSDMGIVYQQVMNAYPPLSRSQSDLSDDN